MPSLFRQVQSNELEPRRLVAAVVYYDQHDRTWMSWPPSSSRFDNSTSTCDDDVLQITLSRMAKLQGELRDSIPLAYCECESHDNVMHLKAHQASSFMLFGWRSLPSADAHNDPTLPARLPVAPMLRPIMEIAPELERGKIDLEAFTEMAIEVFFLEHQVPSLSQFPKGTLFLGFERHYLHASRMSAFIWTMLEEYQPEGSDYIDAIGSATFLQIIESVDIHVFSDDSALLLNKVRLGSGASFEVTIGDTTSSFDPPPYKDGTRRRGWKKDSLIILKQPKLETQCDPSASSQPSRSAADGVDHHKTGFLKTVVNELLILSHPPLRHHPNFVYLYGIHWNKADIGSAQDPCPILIQSCADHGNLGQYLIHMVADGKLSWVVRCDIIRQILTGLRDLHACGIVHGDIKAMNILVATGSGGKAKPRVMLSDFGYSVISHKGQENIEVIGATRRFASPEMSRCIESCEKKMPLDQAFASDI